MPHDFKTLARLMRGDKMFCDRLEYGLKNNLINNSNEPGFLATFVHADRHDLAFYWAHQMKSKGYGLAEYSENNDTGSITSYYVFITRTLNRSGFLISHRTIDSRNHLQTF